MIVFNQNYTKLNSSYLFSDIAKKVAAFQGQNPSIEVIKLGIGDVTLPLPPACIAALHKAVDEMANVSTFRGYGPEQGYPFLREAICQADYHSRGVSISAEEIFVSDGSKCDCGNFQELFSTDISVGIPDPVYPVYLDTNVMAGRTGGFIDGRYQGIVYLESTPENDYLPEIPKQPVDLLYLCFPNNPTGRMIDRETLARWVAYARENNSLILYDSAYCAFIRDDSLPASIFEIPGAQEVAVEFRSFSKTAGFTGTRCAYTVVPKQCRVFDDKGNPQSLWQLWNRRHATKFNGVSYPVQRAAEAVYSAEGQAQVKELSDYYMGNASLIRQAIEALGLRCVGGVHAPYVWIYTAKDSWKFFDQLLNQAGVVCTPGAGFGKCGEGHVRLSAFNSREKVEMALERLSKIDF